MQKTRPAHPREDTPQAVGQAVLLFGIVCCAFAMAIVVAVAVAARM